MGLLVQPRELRRDSTPAERKLWQVLRKQQVSSLKSRRQVRLERYLPDFYSPSVRMVVELDGVSHTESPGGAERNQWMIQQEVHVLRFSNLEVFSNLEGVLTAIAETARNLGGKKSAPPLLAGGGRGEREQSALAGGVPTPPPNPLSQGEEENSLPGTPPTPTTPNV